MAYVHRIVDRGLFDLPAFGLMVIAGSLLAIKIQLNTNDIGARLTATSAWAKLW